MPARYRTTLARLCCLSFLALGLVACAASSPGGSASDSAGAGTVMSTGARRADPGYIQYLERLSMLSSQMEMARIVSGSQLAWLRPADTPDPGALLSLADSWLVINPLAMLPDGKKNAFSALASPRYWQLFDKARMAGVYFAPVSGSGALWAYNRKASTRGDDVIQYAFSEAAGLDDDYFRMLNTASSGKKLVGLEMTPATTGFGPDFFLAARYHRQYAGMYCMVELPNTVWSSLPAVGDQWRGESLSDAQVAQLADARMLPRAMAQDFFPAGKLGGWAVTGEIHGVDGLMRRWAYRYHTSPERPVLNWEDPSAGARRALSGSAIRNVGILGATLVGIRLEGLYGLDAATPGAAKRFLASPAADAAVALGREIRRYGGWGWLNDELPLSALATLMLNGPDFFLDSVFSPGIEHALLTGSTTLLEAMTDDALVLGLDMRRLVHATAAERGINYTLAHLAEVATGGVTSSISPKEADDLRRNTLAEAQNAVYASTLASPGGQDLPPLKDRQLNTTTAGVAALALGAGNAHSVTPEMAPRVRDAHLLQLFFRSMLPGLFMVSGQDIAGSLPVSWYSVATSSEGWDVSLASRGAYAFTQGVPATAATAQGVPRAKSVYPTADVQISDPSSFLTKLADLIAIRSSLGIAHGSLHGRFVTNAPGCFALALILPPPGGALTGTAVQADAPVRIPAVPDGQAPLLRGDENRPSSAAERRRAEFALNEMQRRALSRRIVTAPTTDAVRSSGDTAVITVSNFSRETVRETFNLQHDPTLYRIRSQGAPVLLTNTRKHAGGENDIAMTYSENTITVTLPPWHGAVVLIGKRPK